MKKLVKGIVEFRKNILPQYRDTFVKLSSGQSPDTLFVACSDSRVVPNLFASTDPGDLYVVRNVGNLIPPCNDGGVSADKSTAAAIEFAIENLNISDIIICGHSECGAMQSLIAGRENIAPPNLCAWLTHGENALRLLEKNKGFAPELELHNRLSQLNVLQQIENLKTYPLIKTRIANNQLKLHGWWFELKHADVYAYETVENKFVLIDEQEAHRILQALEKQT